MPARTVSESKQNARLRLASILAQPRERSAPVLAAIAALIAKWSLTAIDATTFGRYVNAVGDNLVSIDSGDTELRSPNNPWTASDVGKPVDVAGAGVAGGTLSTTIAAYNNAGSVELSVAASTSVAAAVASAGGLAVWGQPVNFRVISPTLAEAAGMVAQAVEAPFIGNLPVFNTEISVVSYGADPTGATDSATAIQAAYNALPATGGGLFFPRGRYKVASALAFDAAKQLMIRGEGKFASRLLIYVAAGDFLTFTGDDYDDQFDIHDIGFDDQVARDAGTCTLVVDGGVNTARIADCDFNGTRRSIRVRNLSRCEIHGNTGTGMDTQLRVGNVGVGNIVNNSFRTGNGASVTDYGDGPCCWVSDSTSFKITANNFQGAGPRERITIRGISSTPTDFTLILDQATSPWHVGDYVVIRGATPAGYNGVWRVLSYTDASPFASVVVASTANLGNASVAGVAEDISACLYVSADAGSCNESQISANLFEEMAFRGYGSAAVYLDGRRSDSRVQGWSITGNYYDLGETGIIAHGKETASTESTVYGINITGGEFENGTRLVLLDQVRGVTINGINGPAFGLTGQGGDNLLPAGIASAAVHIIAGANEPKSRGITVQNCNLGMGREWGYQQWSPYAMDCAICLDGAGIQDVLVTGCQLYGKVKPVASANSALAASSRWNFKGNACAAVNGPGWVVNDVIPVVASAGTIDLSDCIGYDTIRVTGSTNIATINGGYVGRRVTMLVPTAFNFITGGNLALAAQRTGAAGLFQEVIFDGTSWYVK